MVLQIARDIRYMLQIPRGIRYGGVGSESSEILMEFRCGAVGVPRITPVVSPQIVDLLHSTHVLFCKSSTLLELSQFLI